MNPSKASLSDIFNLYIRSSPSRIKLHKIRDYLSCSFVSIVRIISPGSNPGYCFPFPSKISLCPLGVPGDTVTSNNIGSIVVGPLGQAYINSVNTLQFWRHSCPAAMQFGSLICCCTNIPGPICCINIRTPELVSNSEKVKREEE